MFGRHSSIQLRFVTIGAWKRKKRGARIGLIGALTIAMIVTGVYVARASHSYPDVPTTAFYHNAVEWIKNRAITEGCTAGLYCPGAASRGEVAVFLQKLGHALTPIPLVFGNDGGAVDLDSNPVLCSGSDYVPGFPQRAHYQNHLDLEAAGPLSVQNMPVFSTNGGASWFSLGAILPLAGTASAHWFSTSAFGRLDLDPGTTYRFGVRVLRSSGTADALNFRCEVFVEIFNRNPLFTPLAPPRRP